MRTINDAITRLSVARSGTELDNLRPTIVADLRQMKPSLVAPVSFSTHAKSLYDNALVLTGGVDCTEDWATVGPAPSPKEMAFTVECMRAHPHKPIHQQAIAGIVNNFVGKTDKEMGWLILQALFLMADDHHFINLMPVAIRTNYNMKYNQGIFGETPLDVREEYEREQGSNWVRPVVSEEAKVRFDNHSSIMKAEADRLMEVMEERGDNTTSFEELAAISDEVRVEQEGQ